MQFYIITALLLFGTISSAYGETQQTVPDNVYPDLEYALSLAQTSAALEPEKLSELIYFIGSIPAESCMSLKERQGVAGAFYSFSVSGDLTLVLDYVYNPDIPVYVTMPSSVRKQEWLTSQIRDALRKLPNQVESPVYDIHLLRGRAREVITADTNTGGYYMYEQDRLLAILVGPWPAGCYGAGG